MSVAKKSELIQAVITQNIGRKGVQHLHRAALQLSHCSPVLAGAMSLYDSTKNGGTVLIASGFSIISAGKCETDGPIGSIVIGKILERIGVHIIFLTDPPNMAMFERLARVAGLSAFQCFGFPFDRESAEKRAPGLLEDLAPAALVAIERPGWNMRLVHHNMQGENISENTSKIDYVFDDASTLRIPSIGIGDGGNEIGMGNIHGTVREHVPFGSRCVCSCGAGIACITKVDHLIVSSVSNWGAYGLAATLSLLAETPFEHSPSEEQKYLAAIVEAGAVDGATAKPIMAVDGLNVEKNMDLVRRICRILEK